MRKFPGGQVSTFWRTELHHAVVIPRTGAGINSELHRRKLGSWSSIVSLSVVVGLPKENKE